MATPYLKKIDSYELYNKLWINQIDRIFGTGGTVSNKRSRDSLNDTNNRQQQPEQEQEQQQQQQENVQKRIRVVFNKNTNTNTNTNIASTTVPVSSSSNTVPTNTTNISTTSNTVPVLVPSPIVPIVPIVPSASNTFLNVWTPVGTVSTTLTNSQSWVNSFVIGSNGEEFLQKFKNNVMSDCETVFKKFAFCNYTYHLLTDLSGDKFRVIGCFSTEKKAIDIMNHLNTMHKKSILRTVITPTSNFKLEYLFLVDQPIQHCFK